MNLNEELKKHTREERAFVGFTLKDTTKEKVCFGVSRLSGNPKYPVPETKGL